MAEPTTNEYGIPTMCPDCGEHVGIWSADGHLVTLRCTALRNNPQPDQPAVDNTARKHVRMAWTNYPDRPAICFACSKLWPCEPGRLATALAAEREQRARLERALDAIMHCAVDRREELGGETADYATAFGKCEIAAGALGFIADHARKALAPPRASADEVTP